MAISLLGDIGGWFLVYIIPHRFLTHWDTQHVFSVGILPVQAQGSKNKWMDQKTSTGP